MMIRSSLGTFIISQPTNLSLQPKLTPFQITQIFKKLPKTKIYKKRKININRKILTFFRHFHDYIWWLTRAKGFLSFPQRMKKNFILSVKIHNKQIWGRTKWCKSLSTLAQAMLIIYSNHQLIFFKTSFSCL